LTHPDIGHHAAITLSYVTVSQEAPFVQLAGKAIFH